jgi:hypothetical protein
MADINTQSCDVCGAVRKETNHWFRVEIGNDEYINGIFIYSWDTTNVLTGHQHTCSDKCTQTLIQRWLDKQKDSHKLDA